MLYNVTTMATTWHTVATFDVSLLKRQLDIVSSLPKDYVFLNYLRCHDDIGWGLDYDVLRGQGMEERAHKQYLNDYFQGYAGGSSSRGELYNADPVTGDARFCGTTASMCGVEQAAAQGDPEGMERAVRLDVMLHGYMFMQSGIPVIYSGDEIGQINDYSYKDNPAKAADSRYVHRGAMDWTLAENIGDPATVQGRLFGALNRLAQIRRREKVFVSGADLRTVDTGDKSVLGLARSFGGEKIIGLFNFHGDDRKIRLQNEPGRYEDLVSGKEMGPEEFFLPAYGFVYLKRP